MPNAPEIKGEEILDEQEILESIPEPKKSQLIEALSGVATQYRYMIIMLFIALIASTGESCYNSKQLFSETPQNETAMNNPDKKMSEKDADEIIRETLPLPETSSEPEPKQPKKKPAKKKGCDRYVGGRKTLKSLKRKAKRNPNLIVCIINNPNSITKHLSPRLPARKIASLIRQAKRSSWGRNGVRRLKSDIRKGRYRGKIKPYFPNMPFMTKASFVNAGRKLN